jgi:1-acyl-sn-glycerol-3-phosphate acyltransferase
MWAMRSLYKWSWLFLNIALKALFGFRVQGQEMVPADGAVIVASNHISLLDPPVVGAAIPREAHFLAKKELFENRLLSWVIKAYNTVPVSRGRPDRAALRRIAELLRQGQAVLLFPEGTRGPGDTLLSGKLGVGKLAVEEQVPIVPAYICASNSLWQTLFRKRRLTVSFGSPIPRGWIETLGQDKSAYRRVVQEVMQRIGALQDSQVTRI